MCCHVHAFTDLVKRSNLLCYHYGNVPWSRADNTPWSHTTVEPWPTMFKHGRRWKTMVRWSTSCRGEPARCRREITGGLSSIWEYLGCVIFKMTVIIKDLYGNSGNRFEKINTPWIFNKIRFALFTWCLPASCVVIFPIRCDLSDFLYPELSLIKRGQGQTHAIWTARRKKPKISGQIFPTAKIPP